MESCLGFEEDMNMEKRPPGPVKCVPFIAFRPLPQMTFLLFEGQAAQIFDFQRQFSRGAHILQRPRPLKPEAGAQNRMLLDARPHRPPELLQVPSTPHM